MNQDCAEAMLMHAAKLTLGSSIEFNYRTDPPDGQVDLGPAFMYTPDSEKQTWFSGNNPKNLLADLNRLDKNKVYFIRSGTNDGAGHWQTCYFDHKKSGWMIYSTARNQYQLTDHDQLTEAGNALIVAHGKWGKSAGQYMLLVVECSKQNLVNAANFLYHYRTLGEDKAIEKALEPAETFHEKIQVTQNKHSKLSQSPDRTLGKGVAIEKAPEPTATTHEKIQVAENNLIKMCNIIDTLVNNIKQRNNSSSKTVKLEYIKTQLEDAMESGRLVNEQRIIQQIRGICVKKSRPMHFWSKPKSVNELDTLLSQNNLSQDNLSKSPKR